MNGHTRFALFAAFAVLSGVLISGSSDALPWDQDMRDQPSVKANETPVKNSAASVPADGKESFRPPIDATQAVHDRLTAGAQLTNPMTKSAESVNRGKELYDTHCATCHGALGHGDGTVGKKFIPPPMDLTLEYVQLQPDGQIWYTISHGSIAMPYYRDSIRDEERWHVVNYIKEVLNPK